MVNLFLTILLLLFLTNNPLGASEITAPIREVIVYPDRALVTREWIVDLPKGNHTVRFSNAISTIQPNSLRAESKDPKTEIIGINTRLEKRNTTLDTELKNLEDSIQDWENKKIANQLQKERLKKDITGINEYSNFLTNYISETSTVESKSSKGSWEKGLEVLAKRRNKTLTSLQSVEREEEAIDKKISLLRKKTERIRSRGDKTYRTIDISLHKSDPGVSKIQFSYIVPNAGWKVSYAVQKLNEKHLQIQYLGKIRQETGEDWNGVSIFLSTSKPSLGGERKPLKPTRIIGREIRPKRESYVQREEEGRQSMALDDFEKESSSGFSPDDLPEEKPSQTGGFTSVESAGENVLFRIPKKANLPSSRRDQVVTIAEFREKIENQFHKLVPGIDPFSHIAIESKNTRSFPLLAGEVNLFRNSGFIGRSNLSYTPSNRKFLLGFGIDRSIQVKRDVKNYREETGALSSGKYFHTLIQMEIKNESDKDAKISLLERIPVSEVEEFQVEIQDDTDSGYQETGKGILNWELELRKRTKKKILLHYRVKAPEDYKGEIYGR